MSSLELALELEQTKVKVRELQDKLDQVESSKQPSFFERILSTKKFRNPREVERRNSDSDTLVSSSLSTTSMVTPSAPLREELNFDSHTEPKLSYKESDRKTGNSSDEEDKYTPNKVSRSVSFGDKETIDELVSQTSIVAKVVTKATEKDEVGKVKLKGVEYEDLHKLLSSYSQDSDQSAVYQFPKEHRKAMERILKVPAGVSLVNHYKNSKGQNQRFIVDITNYLTSARDFSIVSIIQ